MNLGKKYNQHGFTVQEMLLAILISLVLLSLSVVAIVTYMRHLQLAQLDNSAKEIFLAAQNRAILLRSSQQLDGLVVADENAIENVEVIPNSDGGIQITVYYIHCDNAQIDQLLPRESIDPALWDGDFWITYEPESGSVIDVFFCDQDLEVGDRFPDFYQEWRAASKTDRRNRKPMVGYYGGEAAESGTTISLRTPVINIYNEDTLRVEVTYWVPRTLDTMGEASKVKLDVTLTYQDYPARLSQTEAEDHIDTEGISYFTYTYTWTLDSLEEEETQFQEISFEGAAGLTYGDDFTVSAEVIYTGDALKVNGARKSASDNSLFAKDSDGDTAYIACLRHLQNLDADWSKAASEKTKAVQKGDIQGVEGYRFRPIENPALSSYDGGAFSIYDLNISGTDASAGMFGHFSGEAGTRKTLENIRLVNPVLTGSSGPAGALVGNGSYLTINNCQVYWENHSEETTNLRDVLGDSTQGIKYQITGSGPAGGLAGTLTHSALTDCSASTLVQSQGPAGGLVGRGSSLHIDRSYAASYLAGPAAAGLVGELTGTGTTISGSYAVGFIDSGNTAARAAGLCLGSGAAAVKSSYSAMLFTAEKTVTNYPLCEVGTYFLTHFLDSDHFGFSQNTNLAVSYSTLIDSAQWSDLFGPDVFASKSIVQSHPYNLQTTLSLNTYIYPGLHKLDHWGDWGAQFQDGSLVYYEVYQDAQGAISYGFNISGLRHLFNDKTVVEDGYAVAYKGTAPIAGIGATLKVTYPTADGNDTETFSYGNKTENPIYAVPDVTNTAGETSNYYLLPLPGKIVNSGYTVPDFYQKITIQDTPNAEITAAGEKIYYYNPHFANTVLSAKEVKEEELPTKAKRLQVEVRTPRHLYNLSLFRTYSSSSNQYRFLQQMDLNYDTYTGYGLFTGSWTQAPIGLDEASPFRCIYYGNCHSITGVIPAVRDAAGNAYQHVGLFGYVTGVLQDIVYQMKEGHTLTVTQSGSSSETLYAGALAGYNGGTVNNCAAFGVRLQANGYQYSTIYLGGLVGENHGTVQNSAVEGASITAEASMSHAYAGGFVGENTAGGIIDRCYAVGKVSVTQARYGTVYACGFAGRSSATLSRSYAAVFLLADGDAQRCGFCPDPSRNCVYLNSGNFTYREENYAALYEDLYATPVTWEALTGQTQGNTSEEITQQAAVNALDMEWGASSNWKGDYPYPAVVTVEKNDTTSLIHYGQWPERMMLGTMGVYYWEKLTIDQISTYHISSFSLTAGEQVMKSSTLSNAHGDGGVVTEYGYGYFSQADTQGAVSDIVLTSSGIGYSTQTYGDITIDMNFSTAAAAENQAANAALAALMDGQYTFHSYNTWQADQNQGLFVIQSGQALGSQPPYGTWKLEQGTYALTVQLNPFFADALSCQDRGQGTAVPTDLPGTEKNPYEVRSIDQLQFINWNSNARTTVRRMDTGNMAKFPYLCYGTGGKLTVRSFYWEQTHDLKGTKGKTYTPIAAVYDDTSESQGVLFGWFGGTYDGNDYLIADVNIAPHSDELIDATSCVGLFGAVYNGTLKNIVLYSADGTAKVEGTNCGMSRWFSIGALAGVAGSSTGSSVVNCTVAGYTIKDTHRSTSAGGWGGTGLGGLIGVSDMNLVGCTAVTNIVLDSVNNDNVRMGGLVGSCQDSINSCYAGGTITVMETSSTPNDRGIYVGGIVGGIYMKPLKVGGGNATVGQSGQQLHNTLKNCYTYVELPSAGSNRFIKGLYAIGGSGELNLQGTSDGNADHGWTNYNNNYYLNSVVLKNNNGTFPTRHPTQYHTMKTDNGKVSGMSYRDMADTKSETGLLHRLNANGAGFSTVTTVSSSGAPLSGRYSFGSDPSLLGRNYPFPTILTQSSNLVSSGKANVHYGDWPLADIRRENGALPVNLDLFADYQEGKGAIHTETLSLEGVSTGGTWDLKIQDENTGIANAHLTPNEDGTQTLSIIALKAGSTVVTVTYALDGSEYTVDIAVNVTAELRLAAKAASPISVFTNETVQTALELRNRNNQALPDNIPVTLTNITVERDPDYLSEASIDREGGLSLTAESGAQAGSTQITVGYDFTYLGNNYHATSSIALSLITPEITLKPLIFTFEAENPDPSQSQAYTGKGEEEFTVSADGKPLEISDLTIIGFEEVLQEYKDILLVEWARDAQGQAQIGTLSISAYSQTVYPAYASVRVQFQYEYAGSTHIVWKDLSVQIKNEAPEQGAEGTEEVPT